MGQYKFDYTSGGLLKRFRKIPHNVSLPIGKNCRWEALDENKFEWSYRYSAFGGREQKRLLRSPHADCGEYVHPWVYYLRGASGELHAIYYGRQTSEATACPPYGGNVFFYPAAYVTNGGEMLTLPDGTKEFYIGDNNGSTRVVVSYKNNQTGVRTYNYGPFGETLLGGENKIGFAGKQLDFESSLYSMGARMYNAETGRFVQPDPLLELFPSHSPYSYAFNNPVSFSDPSGLAPVPEKRDKIQSSIWNIWDFISCMKIYGYSTITVYADRYDVYVELEKEEGNRDGGGGGEDKGGGPKTTPFPGPYSDREFFSFKSYPLSPFGRIKSYNGSSGSAAPYGYNGYVKPEGTSSADAARVNYGGNLSSSNVQYYSRTSEITVYGDRWTTWDEIGFQARSLQYAVPLWGPCARSADAICSGNYAEGILWYTYAFGEAYMYAYSLASKVAGTAATTTTAQWEFSQFSSDAINEGVNYIMRNPNNVHHIFDNAAHNLGPLVSRLGGQANTIRAVLNAADGSLPSAGVFRDVMVNVSGYNVYIRGSVVNGIPKIGTMFIK